MKGAQLIALPEGKDALFLPVDKGYIDYLALIDGSIDICDLYDMIDYIKVKNENEIRIRKAYASSRGE